MRILHLDSGGEMRGGQWQVLRLMEGLRASGIESFLLARNGSPLDQRARENGFPTGAWGLARALYLAPRFDLVHAHDARSHTVAALARRTPLIVARRVAFRVGSRWKYRRASRYIAVSNHVKSVLIAGAVPEDKIAVVYDGVPVLPPATGSLALAPANASDPQKGAALALRAASLAGIPLRLSADLESDLPQASLFVYITHSEGLGSAALLAMSAGLAVIASDVGGLREIITHLADGLLVENSPAAIAGALKELEQHPGMARQLGGAARQTVRQRFTIERMVAATIEVYRQVLS